MYNLKIRSEENSSLKYLIMKTKLAINGKTKIFVNMNIVKIF